ISTTVSLPSQEAVISRNTSSPAPAASYAFAISTGSPASLRSTKFTPFTTRPLFTSRQGIILFVNISAFLPFKLRKVLQDLNAHSAAFLRMELTSEHIAFFHRGMDAGAVFRHRPDDLRLLRLKIIGMDKIYIRVLRDPPEQSSVVLKVK